MTVGIASDHRGFLIKQEVTKYLKENGYNIIDYGTTSDESVDYPKYAFKVGEAIDKEIQYGILICGSGIGMSIACNKVRGIRCAKADSVEDAIASKLHNNANVIAISANNAEIIEIVEKFLKTDFSKEERHIRRVNMIDTYVD